MSESLAYKQLISEIYERIRAYEKAGETPTYAAQIQAWSTRSRWAEREAQQAEDLIALIDRLIAEAST
ncbi:MAG: hypothetical protein ACO32I_04385 [Candidatus Limnocylindrus sp.]|jgi:hypothetical protein